VITRASLSTRASLKVNSCLVNDVFVQQALQIYVIVLVDGQIPAATIVLASPDRLSTIGSRTSRFTLAIVTLSLRAGIVSTNQSVSHGVILLTLELRMLGMVSAPATTTREAWASILM
jgi:hypothetical protein